MGKNALLCLLCVCTLAGLCVGDKEEAVCASGQAETSASSSMLQAKRFVKAASNQSEISKDDVEAMVYISDAVYFLNSQQNNFKKVKGWTLKRALEVTSADGKTVDNIALYKKKSTCAVAFAGTDDVNDVANNAAIGTEDFCGLKKVHKGFLAEFKALTGSAEFHDKIIKTYLAKQSKCSEVYVVGHSLGGAVAAIFAAVVNDPGNANSCSVGAYSLDTSGFKVDQLITVGAPAVSKVPLANSGGCFSGLRLYNEDPASSKWFPNKVDPVPWGMQAIGFRHPRMDAVRMEDKNNAFTRYDYACDSTDVEKRPKGILTWATSLHLRSEYEKRATALFITR